jgi:hypothetical protein
MLRRLAQYVFASLAVLAVHSTAHAIDASGRWQSDSGNTFIIPASRTEFELIKRPLKGKDELIQARWIEGMVGTQFTYLSNQQTCTATFNLRNPDSLHVVCGTAPANTWTRVAQAPRGRPGGLVGTWKSSSGNTFLVPEWSRTEFDIVVTHTDGKKEIYKAHWVEGLEGTQFTYGPAGSINTATRNGENQDQIRIVGPKGDVFIWQRVDTGMPAPRDDRQ